MVMTRKDYRAIAEAVNKTAQEIYDSEVWEIADKHLQLHGLMNLVGNLGLALFGTNPNYDVKKFWEATAKAGDLNVKAYEDYMKS